MNNISKNLLLAFAIIEIVFIGILVGNKIIQNKTVEGRCVVQADLRAPSSITESSDQGLQYANIEESLKNEKYSNGNSTSLVFAFSVIPFHKDWTCISLGYNENGYRVICQQKECSAWEKAPGFGKRILDSAQQQSCNDEYITRDFPKSLHNVTITASKFETENEVKDFSMVINQEKLKKTAKSIPYEFSSESKGEYQNSYFATFYSPFELTSRMSNLGGTFYGADWIYGKYVISTDIKGENIENKVNLLFKQIIDSINFIKPNDDF